MVFNEKSMLVISCEYFVNNNLRMYLKKDICQNAYPLLFILQCLSFKVLLISQVFGCESGLLNKNVVIKLSVHDPFLE